MSQPTKEQLILEWEIATNEAMAALAAWAKQLEMWRLSGQAVPDKEFMAAYAKLANYIGSEWVDFPPNAPNGIDGLREALTGLSDAYGFEPANGDGWAPYVSGSNTVELTEDDKKLIEEYF